MIARKVAEKRERSGRKRKEEREKGKEQRKKKKHFFCNFSAGISF